MNIIGTTIPPLVFPPVDRVVRARVRVVEGLPFGLILGAAFVRHSCVIDFERAGFIEPTKDSRAVYLSRRRIRSRGVSGHRCCIRRKRTRGRAYQTGA